MLELLYKMQPLDYVYLPRRDYSIYLCHSIISR